MLTSASTTSSDDDIELQELNTEEHENYEATKDTTVIVQVEAPEEKKVESVTPNESVRKITLVISHLSRAQIVLLEVFLFKYVREACNEMGVLAGFELNEIAKITIIPAAAFATADLAASLLLFDAESVAVKASKDFANGFLADSYSGLKNMVASGEILKFSSVIAMAGIFPLSSYIGLAPIMGLLKSGLGAFYLIPTVGLLGLGSCYYVLSQGEGNLKAVDFYLNKPNQQLCPQQKPVHIIVKEGSLKDFLVALQFGVEVTSSCLNRMFFFGFIAYLAAVEAGLSPMGIMLAEASAVIGSQLAYTPLRTRVSREKYYGKGDTAAQRYDLVTEADRKEAYDAIHKDMSWFDFIKKEILRALSPLGLSEVFLASYLAQALTTYLSEIELLAGWPIEYALPAAFAIIAGAATYTMFRVADSFLELNTKALSIPAIHDRISADIANARLTNGLPELTISANTNVGHAANGWNTNKIAAALSYGAWSGRVLANVPATMRMLGDYTNTTKLAQIIIGLTTGIIPAISNKDFFIICIEKTLNIAIERRQKAANQSVVVTETPAASTPAPVPVPVHATQSSMLFSVQPTTPRSDMPENPAWGKIRCGLL